MQGYIKRLTENAIKKGLLKFPVVVLLGPRQCGKSTTVKELSSHFDKFLYLDMENPRDRKKTNDIELFFDLNRENVICLDEIQLLPEIFPILRSIIDKDRKNTRLILLGSASPDLIRQSSESLAGRIYYLELTPFMYRELDLRGIKKITQYWLKGGFPESYLTENNEISFLWRENFIRSYIERDLPQLGIHIPALKLHRFFTMCAHSQGQLLNISKLGESLGVSPGSVRHYIDIFENVFLLRTLRPYAANIKKRLVKSPKVYIRDSGVLHTLLEIEDFETLMGHPVYGASWEGFVIENILNHFPKWRPSFYRTSSGAEIDLILERGGRTIGIECKASSDPKLSKGFWNVLEDLKLDEVWIICPIEEMFFIRQNVRISSLKEFLCHEGQGNCT